MISDVIMGCYHESGHVVVGYLMGFTVKKMQVFEDGGGETTFDYGSQTLLCSSILSLPDFELFKMLDENSKKSSPEYALRLLHMLLGGPVAESLASSGFIPRTSIKVEVSGKDLQKCNVIDAFLAKYTPAYDHNTVNKAIDTVYQFLSHQSVTHTLTTLVEALKASGDFSIDKSNIESIIKNTGFLELTSQWFS